MLGLREPGAGLFELFRPCSGVELFELQFADQLFGAGLAGALYYLSNLRISPDVAFGVNWTAFTIFIVLIGGIGTIEGPILGALIFWFLNKFFSDYGSWYLIGLGLLAIVIVIKLRAGLWGAISKKFDLHLFPVQRRVKLREK